MISSKASSLFLTLLVMILLNRSSLGQYKPSYQGLNSLFVSTQRSIPKQILIRFEVNYPKSLAQDSEEEDPPIERNDQRRSNRDVGLIALDDPAGYWQFRPASEVRMARRPPRWGGLGWFQPTYEGRAITNGEVTLIDLQSMSVRVRSGGYYPPTESGERPPLSGGPLASIGTRSFARWFPMTLKPSHLLEQLSECAADPLLFPDGTSGCTLERFVPAIKLGEHEVSLIEVRGPLGSRTLWIDPNRGAWPIRILDKRYINITDDGTNVADRGTSKLALRTTQVDFDDFQNLGDDGPLFPFMETRYRSEVSATESENQGPLEWQREVRITEVIPGALSDSIQFGLGYQDPTTLRTEDGTFLSIALETWNLESIEQFVDPEEIRTKVSEVDRARAGAMETRRRTIDWSMIVGGVVVTALLFWRLRRVWKRESSEESGEDSLGSRRNR